MGKYEVKVERSLTLTVDADGNPAWIGTKIMWSEEVDSAEEREAKTHELGEMVQAIVQDQTEAQIKKLKEALEKAPRKATKGSITELLAEQKGTPTKSPPKKGRP